MNVKKMKFRLSRKLKKKHGKNWKLLLAFYTFKKNISRFAGNIIDAIKSILSFTEYINSNFDLFQINANEQSNNLIELMIRETD